MKEKIKSWYMATYPTDDLGEYINDDVTFEDVMNGMLNGLDVYKILGAGDSIVRTRVFLELSDLRGREYDYIYTVWLQGAA